MERKKLWPGLIYVQSWMFASSPKPPEGWVPISELRITAEEWDIIEGYTMPPFPVDNRVQPLSEFVARLRGG